MRPGGTHGGPIHNFLALRVLSRDNDGMFNERHNVRYLTQGKARIDAGFEGEALLNDLSTGGCCLEFSPDPAIDDTVIYRIEIVPEPEAALPVFSVSAEPRWIRPAPWSCAVGFLFTSTPKGRQIQNYMDYLARSQGR